MGTERVAVEIARGVAHFTPSDEMVGCISVFPKLNLSAQAAKPAHRSFTRLGINRTEGESAWQELL